MSNEGMIGAIEFAEDDWEIVEERQPGYKDADEFWTEVHHWENTIERIMTRWSAEIEPVMGEAKLGSLGLEINYHYDRWDDGRYWTLPFEVFWDLEGVIIREKAARAERRREEEAPIDTQ